MWAVLNREASHISEIMNKDITTLISKEFSQNINFATQGTHRSALYIELKNYKEHRVNLIYTNTTDCCYCGLLSCQLHVE